MKEIGMCPALDDREFFRLLTNNGTENIKLIEKYYPKLTIYIKK